MSGFLVFSYPADRLTLQRLESRVIAVWPRILSIQRSPVRFGMFIKAYDVQN